MNFLNILLTALSAVLGFLWYGYSKSLKSRAEKAEAKLSESEINEVKRSISDEVNNKELADLVADQNKRYGSGDPKS